MMSRILTCFLILIFCWGCSNTVYVHQNQQSYNDYKVYKYKKIENKTKKPNYSKYLKKNDRD